MPVSLTSYVASLMKVILCSSFVRSRVADAEVSKLCSRQQAMCSSEGTQVFKTSSQPAHTTFPIATMQLSFFFLNLFIYLFILIGKVALVVLMPEATVTEVRSDYLTPGPNATPQRGLCCRAAALLLC